MMRVAVAFEYPTVSGGENSMLAVMKWLCHSPGSGSVEPVALCPPDGALRERLDELGIAVVAFDRHGATREAQMDALCDVVRGVEPDVLHGNSLAMGRLLGAVAPRLPCPTTAHLRDILKLSGAAMRDLNQNAHLMAVSEATRAFHISQGLNADRSSVVYNGVNVPVPEEAQTAARRRIRQERKIPADAFVLLTAGQIGLRKGLDTLAETAVRLAASGRSLHWLIAGERFSRKQESIDFERNVFATFQNAAPGITTHRLGYRRDIGDLMRASDVLVHGARQEPLGRVLLEAAALRLPILATDAGGTREIIVHERSGLLVRPDDPAAMAAAIERLMDDVQERERLARAAAVRMAADFRVEDSALRLAALWRSVIRRPPIRRAEP